LHSQNLIHALETQAPLAIEEVRDMRLFESGLLSQTQASQAFLFNAVPKSFAKVFLQDFEFHKAEYTMVYSESLLIMSF